MVKLIQHAWLEDLKSWVREFPCVVVRLEDEEWELLSESRRGLAQFTIARSHGFFDRVRVPTLCFVFGTVERFRNRERIQEEFCLVGKLSSRSRVSSLETRVKISRALPLKGLTESSFSALLTSSTHDRNLRERMHQAEAVIPLSPELSRALIEAIAADNQNAAILKTVASGIRRNRSFSSTRALQDDAINSALRAFGIEDHEGASELQVDDDRESALSSVPVREDTVIQHDARSVRGYEYIGGDITGRAVFEQQNRRLEIFTANRQPLEQVFGVDLIYLNLSQRNLVMVQYKMLERHRSGVREDWIYRPDGRLASEITRMERFATLMSGPLNEYRLNSDPFYLKFVKRNGLFKNGSILTPLAHFKHIVQSPIAEGPGGGIRISYDSLDGSYMRHGTFIDLMQAGYIGSYASDTDNFKTLIAAVLADNRSVVAALQSGVTGESGQQPRQFSRFGR